MATFAAAFLGILSQLKVLHWQTKSYAKHVAYGGTYDALDGLIDSFTEIYMGKYGRVIIEQDDAINLEFLLSMDDKLDQTKDTDLLNIRDEMLAEINKLKYLLTLQ